MFDLSTFTAIHTGLSLIALAAGIIVVIGLIRGHTLASLSALYFATSVLTSATGFGFPFVKFLPSHAVGILSLIALVVAIAVRYLSGFTGGRRTLYAIATSISVYFLVFVTIAQAFSKVPSLHALAPTLAEPPFLIAQSIALIAFVALTIAAVKGLGRSVARAPAN